ncbi:MAG: hypothetical protein O2951_13700 [Bacteroidetes bacterium]|nr:hypothetical protein [Bacteroidota bacterium]
MGLYFAQSVLKETSGLLGGLPVDNLQSIYDGFGFNDEELNKNVKRYSKIPRAVEHVLNYYTPTGQIADPIIAMHATYDELLPASNYNYYEQATFINNTNHLYRQKYVVRDGHCAFSNEEVAESFDQLVNWIKTGERPEYQYK